MIDEFNVKAFIDEYLEKIINMKDENLNYQDLQEVRQNIIEKYDLNIAAISSKQIVKYLKESEYAKLFENIQLNEAANVIFLKKVDSSEVIEIFDNMTKGLNERNILKKIYTHNKMFEDQYGVDLSDLEKFFNDCKYHLKFEIMGNMATFIEKVYETPAGKQFIDSYKDIKDEDGKKEYFISLFEQMNNASIRKIFHKDNDDNVKYLAAGAGTLDGFFTIFDKDNNMNFNVSTTASPDVKIEGTSIMRHAITSKLIAEAIVDEINKKIIMNKDHDPFYGDNADDFKKMRAYYWNKMIDSSKGHINQEKNYLIGKALIAKIEEYNLFKIDKSLLTEDSLNSGKTIEGLVKLLNQQNPIETINMRLGTEGVITKNKMHQFFDSRKDEGFQTNFLTEIKAVKNVQRYSSSGLKELFEKAHINMYEFKTFLQNAALKNITLDEYNGGINKEAIDHFYDNVITRRVFSSANQVKINLQSFAERAESLFCKILVLPDQEKVNSYLRCLTGLDYGNVRDNLMYTLKTGDAETKQDINKSPVSHITERLAKLKVDIDPITFLDKIRVQYKIELAKIFQSAAINFEKRVDADEKNRELEEKVAMLEAQLAAKNKTNSECDYSGQLSVVSEMKKDKDNKSTQLQKNNSTIKKKIN